MRIAEYLHIQGKRIFIMLGGMLPLLFSCADAQSQAGANATHEIRGDKLLKMMEKGESVVINNAIILDDVDFTRLSKKQHTFPGRMEHIVEGNITFVNCIFMGRVTGESSEVVSKRASVINHTRFLSDVCFYECDFRQSVRFGECLFQGDLTLTRSVCRDTLCLNNILVNGRAIHLENLETEGVFEMSNASVRGDLNMMDAAFHKSAILSNLSVNNLQMSNASFGGYLDLSNSTVNGYLLFNYGKCEGESHFDFSRFFGRTSFIETHFAKEISIEQSLFMGTSKWNRAAFAEGINTANALFAGSSQWNDVQSLKPIEVQCVELSRHNIQ